MMWITAIYLVSAVAGELEVSLGQWKVTEKSTAGGPIRFRSATNWIGTRIPQLASLVHIHT
jgi:hypothetical protein